MKIRANLSLDPDLYEEMKKTAQEKETTVSALISNLFLIYRDAAKEVENKAV